MVTLKREKFTDENWNVVLKALGLNEEGAEITTLEVEVEGVVRYYPDKKENELELLGSNEQEFNKEKGYQ